MRSENNNVSSAHAMVLAWLFYFCFIYYFSLNRMRWFTNKTFRKYFIPSIPGLSISELYGMWMDYRYATWQVYSTWILSLWIGIKMWWQLSVCWPLGDMGWTKNQRDQARKVTSECNCWDLPSWLPVLCRSFIIMERPFLPLTCEELLIFTFLVYITLL